MILLSKLLGTLIVVFCFFLVGKGFDKVYKSDKRVGVGSVLFIIYYLGVIYMLISLYLSWTILWV